MLVVALGSFLGGWLVRSVTTVSGHVTKWIDLWVLNVALPLLIVSRMSRASFGADIVVPALAAWVAMVVCAVLIVAMSGVFGWSTDTWASLLLVGVLGNTSFLGLAVVEGALGTSALDAAIAYDQLGSFLVLATWGSFVAAHWGSGEAGTRAVFGRMVRFAPFLALCVSPLVAWASPPDALFDILDVPAATTAPLAMFGLGIRFTVTGQGANRRAGACALVVKMLVVPLVVWGLLAVAGQAGTMRGDVAVLQAAAPPMVTAGVVAVSAGLAPVLAAWVVGVGTLAALVLMPVWTFIVSTL